MSRDIRIMRSLLAAAALLCAVACGGEGRVQRTLDSGWGNDIEWVQTYEEGLLRAKETRQPLMLIIWLETCPYSKELRNRMSQHRAIQKLASESFICLNVRAEPNDQNLAPDGRYVPRIMFVDPSWTVRGDITGRYSNHLYLYHAADVDLLYKSMNRALQLLKDEL
ncbi:unnamed protein product [Lampetra fluviatilis]